MAFCLIKRKNKCRLLYNHLLLKSVYIYPRFFIALPLDCFVAYAPRNDDYEYAFTVIAPPRFRHCERSEAIQFIL